MAVEISTALLIGVVNRRPVWGLTYVLMTRGFYKGQAVLHKGSALKRATPILVAEAQMPFGQSFGLDLAGAKAAGSEGWLIPRRARRGWARFS